MDFDQLLAAHRLVAVDNPGVFGACTRAGECLLSANFRVTRGVR